MSLNQSLIVETQGGTVQGTEDGRIKAFYGIRYAKPPQRFQPPQPPEAWSGVFVADQFGPTAPQPDPLPYNPRQSEDCLTLNIWTPENDRKSRPVLVYIHGGGFVSGTGSNPLYSGKTFAENGDIVVVTVNYRLGVLGFLDLGHILGEGYRSSGNCGLLDLIQALRWIQANISGFGGDPRRVTIMGQSAGAKCVGGLLSSPLAAGLFHQAILMSGSVQSIRHRSTSGKLAEAFIGSLGWTPQEADRLLELPVSRLMAAQGAWVKDLRGVHLFGPVIDGITIDQPPLQGLAARKHQLPALLIGTTRNETAGFMAGGGVLGKPTVHLLDSMFGSNAGAVRRAYERLSQRTIEEADTDLGAWEAVLTDYMYRMAAIRTAQAYSSAGAPVWLYRFDRAGNIGAAHGNELAFVWHNQFPSEETGLADSIHQAWISFIHSGSPQQAFPQWPPCERGRLRSLLLDHKTGIDELRDYRDDPDYPIEAFTLL
ncbi:MAG: hypothetical protein K0R57_2200 [Paenibacillaceae bacterium]|nr:hypothetical protein [Paenibacillaceae bacterium]